MPRIAKHVAEARDELQRLARRNGDTSSAPLLRMVLLLKEYPTMTWSELARRLEVSPRTVQRWWETYARYGIEGLLAVRPYAGRAQGAERATDEATEYPPDGPRAEQIEQGGHPEGSPLPAEAIDFLNALVLTPDPREWAISFRNRLCRLLPDVDHVVVNLCTTLELIDPAHRRADQIYREHSLPTGERFLTAVSREEEVPHHIQIVEDGRRAGFPFERYHEPEPFDLYLSRGTYLGTILLLRERSKPPISWQTLHLVEILQPFLYYVFSSEIAYIQARKPSTLFFKDLVRAIAGSADLTRRQQQVLTLLILGRTQGEIADALAVSTRTVQKHVSALYQRLGIRSRVEIFTRYLTSIVTYDESTDKGIGGNG